MQGECFCGVVKRLTLLTAGLAVVLASSTASAQVIPLVPKMDPAKAGEIISLFHKALADGLKQGGAKIMEPADVLKKLKLPPANAGCAAGACLNTALTVFGKKRFGAAMVKSVGKNYRIEVRLYDGKSKLAGVSGRCDVCTLAEALKKTRKLATEIGGKAENPPGAATKKATTKKTPPKAVGTKSGASTTTKKAAGAGAATKGTKTAKAGGTGAAASGKSGAGTTGSKAAGSGAGAGASAGGAGGAGSDTGRRWPLWPALVSAGVGVVGLAVGIPLLSIDGDFTNCQGTALPDGRNCADIVSTSGGGWLMTGLGIAGIAASGVLFFLYFRSRGADKKTASLPGGLNSLGLVPTSGGVVLGASGRF